ncbi:MAG TPA: [FeFe] hydrogenase H-cluster maturation GTPase HydF [Bacillota bacterium]
MEATPRGERLHVAIFGRRNAGKSTLINALSNQDVAIVSPVPGTTTDPVYRSMEILPIGPVVLIDTAGIDDVGDLGQMRIRSTLRVLNRTDLALLVIDATAGPGEYEQNLLKRLKDRDLPAIAVINKVDLVRKPEDWTAWGTALGVPVVPVSGESGEGIEALKQKIIEVAPSDWSAPAIVGDLIDPGDLVFLVVPIDLAAPKGRLILPQVQTLRDILDHDAYAVMVKEYELREALANQVRRPRLVITDSQAFLKVDADTPSEVRLTSFSILFARYKGDLEALVAGAKAVDSLRPGDRVLIAEACTHHRQADDIGRVKIPRWLRQRVGGDLQFSWVSGMKYPDDLETYKLVVHCGGCMINRREMLARIGQAREKGVPIVNYGVLIAYLLGLLPRALEPFPAARQLIIGL